MFFTSQKINIKRSPNAAKLYGDFLWTRRHPMGQGSTWWVVPTSGLPRTASLLYKYPNILETLGESTKFYSSRRRVQNHQIQSRHHHGGVQHFHWCLSDDA